MNNYSELVNKWSQDIKLLRNGYDGHIAYAKITPMHNYLYIE